MSISVTETTPGMSSTPWLTTPWIDARMPDGSGGVLVVINSGIALTEAEIVEMKAAWGKLLAGAKVGAKDIVVIGESLGQ